MLGLGNVQDKHNNISNSYQRKVDKVVFKNNKIFWWRIIIILIAKKLCERWNADPCKAHFISLFLCVCVAYFVVNIFWLVQFPDTSLIFSLWYRTKSLISLITLEKSQKKEIDKIQHVRICVLIILTKFCIIFTLILLSLIFFFSWSTRSAFTICSFSV